MGYILAKDFGPCKAGARFIQNNTGNYWNLKEDNGLINVLAVHRDQLHLFIEQGLIKEDFPWDEEKVWDLLEYVWKNKIIEKDTKDIIEEWKHACS